MQMRNHLTTYYQVFDHSIIQVSLLNQHQLQVHQILNISYGFTGLITQDH